MIWTNSSNRFLKELVFIPCLLHCFDGLIFKLKERFKNFSWISKKNYLMCFTWPLFSHDFNLCPWSHWGNSNFQKNYTWLNNRIVSPYSSLLKTNKHNLSKHFKDHLLQNLLQVFRFSLNHFSTLHSLFNLKKEKKYTNTNLCF